MFSLAEMFLKEAIALAAENGDISLLFAFRVGGQCGNAEFHQPVVADEAEEIRTSSDIDGVASFGVIYGEAFVVLSGDALDELLDAGFDGGSAPGVDHQDSPCFLVLEDQTLHDGLLAIHLSSGQAFPSFTFFEVGAGSIRAPPVEVVGRVIAVANFFRDWSDALGFIIAEGDIGVDDFGVPGMLRRRFRVAGEGLGFSFLA